MPDQPRKPTTEAPKSNHEENDPLYERRVMTMRKAIIPGITASAAHLEKHVSTQTVGAYVYDFAQRAGGCNDPVEEVIVRQLAQADLVVGQLLGKANNADNPLAAAAYGSTACRLISEVRRLALALKTYRASDEPRRTTIVHQVSHIGQQNVADRQEVVYNREGGDGTNEGRVSMKCEDSKLFSRSNHEDRFAQEEPSSRRSRQAEPCQA